MNECFFTNFYKQCYLDIKDLTNNEAKKHYNTIGIKEGRIPNFECYFFLLKH